MSEDNSKIPVEIPKPWRTICQCVAIVSVVQVLGVAWRIFIFPDPPDEPMYFMAGLTFFSAPLLFLYCLPAFTGNYPEWMVRLFGRKHLLKLIADCKKHLGDDRKNKARLNDPKGWRHDQRFSWIFIIMILFLLGIFNAMHQG